MMNVLNKTKLVYSGALGIKVSMDVPREIQGATTQKPGVTMTTVSTGDERFSHRQKYSVLLSSIFVSFFFSNPAHINKGENSFFHIRVLLKDPWSH